MAHARLLLHGSHHSDLAQLLEFLTKGTQAGCENAVVVG